MKRNQKMYFGMQLVLAIEIAQGQWEGEKWGKKEENKIEWFRNKLYSLQQLNMRNVMVFNYMILVRSNILFGNKNKNILQFGIILSTETIVFESSIQFFGMTDNFFFKLLKVFKNN